MDTLIRAANLNGVIELVTELGGDPYSLLARFHIDPELISNPEAYVPFRSVTQVFEQAAKEYSCPDFGLRMVRWQGLGMLGPVAVIARNSDTVLEAFQSLMRYLHVHGPALKCNFLGRNTAGDYCYDYRMDESMSETIVQGYELSLINAAHILRLLAGQTARPARVYFTHAPLSPQRVYTKAFGCPVEFNAAYYGFDFKEGDMHRALVGADTHTRQLAKQFLESYHPLNTNISDRVVELIHRLLSTGHCSLALIAEQLAMHPRTLQRALRECDTSYETLLDDIRRGKAREYIAQTSIRFSQISALLGYTDQSTFNRACRRWFGCTPKALRQQV